MCPSAHGTTVVQNYSKRMKLAIGGWSVMLMNMYWKWAIYDVSLSFVWSSFRCVLVHMRLWRPRHSLSKQKYRLPYCWFPFSHSMHLRLSSVLPPIYLRYTFDTSSIVLRFPNDSRTIPERSPNGGWTKDERESIEERTRTERRAIEKQSRTDREPIEESSVA